MNIKLRSAEAGDRDAVLSIAGELPEYFNENGRMTLAKDLSTERAELIQRDGSVVGFVILSKNVDPVGEILWMAVDKSHQSQGLGTQLLQHTMIKAAFEHCRILKVKTLAPSVDYPPYEGTRRFYEKAGFVLLEDVDPYEPWGEGNPCRIYGKSLFYLTVGSPVNPLVTRSSRVSLKEITTPMVRDVCRLSVLDHQHRFVAHNTVSLAQACFEPKAWTRAVYADETLVGFVMVYDNDQKHEYTLWRFMIDGRYQHLGFGRQALAKVVDYVRTRPGAKEFLAYVVQEPQGPQPFYEALGFSPTGKVDEDGEAELRLSLE